MIARPPPKSPQRSVRSRNNAVNNRVSLLERIRGAKVAVAAISLLSLGLIGRLVVILLETGASASAVRNPWLDGLKDVAMALLATGLVGIVYEYFIRRESEERLAETIDQALEHRVGEIVQKTEMESILDTSLRGAFERFVATWGFEDRLLARIQLADWHYSNYRVSLRLKRPGSNRVNGFRQIEVDLRYKMVCRKPTKIDCARVVLTSSLELHRKSMGQPGLQFTWLCRLLSDNPDGHKLMTVEFMQVNRRTLNVAAQSVTAQTSGGVNSWTVEIPINGDKAEPEYDVELRVLVPLNADHNFLFYAIDQCAETCSIEIDCSDDAEVGTVVPLPMIGSMRNANDDLRIINGGKTVKLSVDDIVMPFSGLTAIWDRVPFGAEAPSGNSRVDPDAASSVDGSA